MKPSFLCLTLMLLCLSAAAAHDEYQLHFDKARKLLRNEDRRGAIKEFEAAFAASPKPEALFDIGVLYRKLAEAGGAIEDARRSVDSFELYLDRYRAIHASDPPDLNTVSRYISELRERFALKAPERAPAQTEPEVKVAVAPVAPVITPPTEAPPVFAPPAEPPKLVAPPPAVAVLPPSVTAPAAPRRDRRRVIAGSVLIGAGFVIAATGSALFALGTSSGSGSDFATAADFNSHTKTFQITGAAMLGVGGAAIVAGVVTLALPSRRDSTTTLRLAPTANGLIAMGSF